MNRQHHTHQELLSYCSTQEQCNAYEQLLNQTSDALQPEQMPDLQPRKELQERLRQKVVAHQTIVHRNGIAITTQGGLRVVWRNFAQRLELPSVAAAAIVCLCVLLSQFAPPTMNSNVMAQDSLSLQSDTILQLGNDVVMQFCSDTIR